MRQERWAFAKGEAPQDCNGRDELWATNGETQVIVYRNGSASNRYADGTVGVTGADRIMAEAEETLWHPDAQAETHCWRNVEANTDGAFIRFIPAED